MTNKENKEIEAIRAEAGEIAEKMGWSKIEEHYDWLLFELKEDPSCKATPNFGSFPAWIDSHEAWMKKAKEDLRRLPETLEKTRKNLFLKKETEENTSYDLPF